MNSEIEQIESNIRQHRELIEQGARVERLSKNADFKKLVMQGYFEQEAIRLVHLKADPAMQTPERQESIIKQIDAIGALHQYFHVISQQADLAEKSIAADEAMREELLREDLNNG